MGRVTTEPRIQERTARTRLKARQNPYWRMISEGRHLGYYRGTRAGKWVARYRPTGDDGYGIKTTLGVADDLCPADGDTILDWKEALDKAMHWFELQAAGGRKLNPNLTVKDAIEAYIEMRDARESAARGRPARSTASFKLRQHVLTDLTFCTIKLCKLNEADLRAWQRRLPAIAASSKVRILSEVKAALNDIYAEQRQALPNDLPVTIKYGCKPAFAVETTIETAGRDNQILTDDQVRRILKKVAELDDEGDNTRLAVVLAATGARFAQISRMLVRDVDLERGWVFVPPSRKGRSKSTRTYMRIQVGPDVIQQLRPIVEGRAPTAPLLERWHHRQVSPTKWVHTGRQAWKTASEMLRWWKTAVEAVGLPDVIPYALRHSSIVRAIGVGVPIRLVAALHDTSIVMIEKHYSRWITESLDEIAARAMVPLLEQAA